MGLTRMGSNSKKLALVPTLLLSILVSSACGTTQGNELKEQINRPITQKHVTSATTNNKSNIEAAPDSKAAEVPKLYYQYLSDKNYSEAIKLLGPQLKFQGAPNFMKYLSNIKQVSFRSYEDISKNPGQIDPSYAKYYRIKVYYAVINIEVRNPNLVQGLEGVNYRRFILIKKTPRSSWLIDTDEDTPPRQ